MEFSTSNTKLRWRSHIVMIFGMAFYWPMFRRNYFGFAISQDANQSLNSELGFFVLLFSLLLFTFIGLVKRKAFEEIFIKKKWAIPLLIVLSFCGNLLALFAYSFDELGIAAMVVGIFVGSLGIVVLTYAWGQTIVDSRLERPILYLAISFSLSFIVSLPAVLSSVFEIALPIVSPVISSIMWVLSSRDSGNRKEFSFSGLSRLASPMVYLLVLFLLVGGFIRGAVGSGVLSGAQIDDHYAIWKACFSFVLSLVIIGIMYYFSKNERFVYICWSVISVVFFVGLFIVAGFSSETTQIMGTIVIPGRTFLSFFLWAMLINDARRKGVSSTLVLGVFFLPVEACSWFLSDFGVLFATNILGIDLMNSMTILALIMASILIIAVFAFLSSFNAKPVSSEQQGASDPHATLDELADRYALTKREAEVMALMSRGYSYKRIAESMHISDSTTQTHVKSLYRKLQVHSRQEIIDLVETNTVRHILSHRR